MALNGVFTDLHWRDTARPLRFFIFDAKVLGVLLVWACHLSWATLALALFGMVFFGALELFGLNFMAALRLFKNWLGGSWRPKELGYCHKRRVQW